MDEQFVGDDWLYATLSGDGTLAAIVNSRIYPDLPGQGTAYPFVTYQLMAAPVLMTGNANVIWVEATYLIKVWVTGRSYQAARPAVKRIGELLHRASGSTANGTVVSSSRTEVMRGSEESTEGLFRWVGQMVELHVQSN